MILQSLDELVSRFTLEERAPRVFHGLGTMLGVTPEGDDRVHWFYWSQCPSGLRYVFSTQYIPERTLALDLSEVAHDAP